MRREKRGQDADICKCSDTHLEKASCSGWLVNSSSHVALRAWGTFSAHWLNLYISVSNVYCSLKPGDYWIIFLLLLILWLLFFFFLFVFSLHVFTTREWFHLDSWGLNVFFSLLWGYVVIKNPSLALLESVQVPLRVPLQYPVALCSGRTQLWRHTRLCNHSVL